MGGGVTRQRNALASLQDASATGGMWSWHFSARLYAFAASQRQSRVRRSRRDTTLAWGNAPRTWASSMTPAALKAQHSAAGPAPGARAVMRLQRVDVVPGELSLGVALSFTYISGAQPW